MSRPSPGPAKGDDRATRWEGSRPFKETYHLRLLRIRNQFLTLNICIWGTINFNGKCSLAKNTFQDILMKIWFINTIIVWLPSELAVNRMGKEHLKVMHISRCFTTQEEHVVTIGAAGWTVHENSVLSLWLLVSLKLFQNKSVSKRYSKRKKEIFFLISTNSSGFPQEGRASIPPSVKWELDRWFSPRSATESVSAVQYISDLNFIFNILLRPFENTQAKVLHVNFQHTGEASKFTCTSRFPLWHSNWNKVSPLLFMYSNWT